VVLPDDGKSTLDRLPAAITLTRKGSVPMRLQCTSYFGTSCTVTIKLIDYGFNTRSKVIMSARSRKKVIGRATVRLLAGKTKLIKVHMSRDGRRRVLAKKRLRCTASSVTRGANGQRSAVSKKITLRAPKRR
jgi:hypothetical protein